MDDLSEKKLWMKNRVQKLKALGFNDQEWNEFFVEQVWQRQVDDIPDKDQWIKERICELECLGFHDQEINTNHAERQWEEFVSDLHGKWESWWEKAVKQLIESHRPVKSNRGPRPYSDKDKLAAVYAWQKVDRDTEAITIEQFLENRFGTTGDRLNVPVQTFYSWRRALKKKGLI